nr:ATP-dependent DNA helicase PIF1-like [Tanacetum cinerariifolium]
MSAALRSKGDIVLNVASISIAALLLEGGRTAHSRFANPINVVEDSMCHIAADRDLDLIRKANLIIWDEAPMINRHCYDAFDRTLRDIYRTDPSVASDKVFGGKVVLFGGDYRQILPVITNGGRHDVVNATINSSYLWEKCNGKVDGANDRESTIVYPDKILIPETDDDVGDENEYESSDSVCLADEDLNFDDSIYTKEFLNGIRMSGIPNHNIKLKIGWFVFKEARIFAWTTICCRLTSKKQERIEGDEKECESSYSVCLVDEDSNFDDSIYTIEFLNGLRMSGLQVLRLGNNIIEAKIISGGNVGKICVIPCMVISSTDTKMSFKLE